MAFDLPNATRGDILEMSCKYFNATEQPEWSVDWSSIDQSKDLPECNYVCLEPPPTDEEVYNRTWSGSFVLGTEAMLECKSKETFFRKTELYLTFYSR